MKKADFITVTYEINTHFYKGFFVDIVNKGDELEAWLYHEIIGVKSLMFGIANDGEHSQNEFIECVENNLKYESYIPNYIEEYGN